MHDIGDYFMWMVKYLEGIIVWFCKFGYWCAWDIEMNQECICRLEMFFVVNKLVDSVLD
jgi:hypothetical protein